MAAPKVRLLPPAITRDTAERHIGWLNNPDVVRFSENRHDVHTIDSQLNYLVSMGHPHAYLEIWLDDHIVGSATAFVDVHNSVANIGVMVGETSVWGMGVGFAAWTLLMDYVFDRNIRKIEAGTMSANLPMLRIMQKSGMYEEGRRHGRFLVDGMYYDEIHYARFNARLTAHSAPTVAGQTAH